MKIKELINLLRQANDVKDIDARREEIVELIPQTAIMIGFDQQNRAHKYDLWIHSLHTVVGLPKDIDDDMLYLAALLHDIGKPDSRVPEEKDGMVIMHYPNHPHRSMELTRDAVIPELLAKGEALSEDEIRRLIYYVEYHDDRVDLGMDHLVRHLAMGVSFGEFQNLMKMQVADAKAHVLIPIVRKRIEVCGQWAGEYGKSQYMMINPAISRQEGGIPYIKETFWGQSYAATDELASVSPLLNTAVEYQKQYYEYLIPYSYWTDKQGRLYIRWSMRDESLVRTVWRYYFCPDGRFTGEEIPRNISNRELLRGDKPDTPVVLITGDTHRHFERLISFVSRFGIIDGELMIILGDAGINYMGGQADDNVKYRLSKLGLKLLCVHGNHEMRPETTGLYKEVEWHGGKVFVEDRYPFLMFAKDGEIYDIAGQKTLVIGGAYSVDKYYRLERGYNWFADEQPSAEIKARVEQQLEKCGWKVDVVLSHTVPYKYQPTDLFIKGLDQSTVDSSTEEWLGKIEEKLQYKQWYAGHYHCDRDVERLKIMYRKVAKFMSDTDLNFEME